MKPRLIFSLFVVLAVVQLAVPVGQITRYEDILRNGTIFKIRTQPVDPYDAFRGRYVALSFAGTKAMLRSGGKFERNSSAYVTLHKDEDGFAQFGDLAEAPPAEGDYLRVRYIRMSSNKAEAHFRLPFNRFYMEESVAPRAEKAYREHQNRGDRKVDDTHVIVRVKSGRGVIEELYIKDKPIRDFLAEDAGIE